LCPGRPSAGLAERAPLPRRPRADRQGVEGQRMHRAVPQGLHRSSQTAAQGDGICQLFARLRAKAGVRARVCVQYCLGEMLPAGVPAVLCLLVTLLLPVHGALASVCACVCAWRWVFVLLCGSSRRVGRPRRWAGAAGPASVGAAEAVRGGTAGWPLFSKGCDPPRFPARLQNDSQRPVAPACCRPGRGTRHDGQVPSDPRGTRSPAGSGDGA